MKFPNEWAEWWAGLQLLLGNPIPTISPLSIAASSNLPKTDNLISVPDSFNFWKRIILRIHLCSTVTAHKGAKPIWFNTLFEIITKFEYHFRKSFSKTLSLICYLENFWKHLLRYYILFIDCMYVVQDTFAFFSLESGRQTVSLVVMHKGQLISEWNLGVFKSPKKATDFLQISALAS